MNGHTALESQVSGPYYLPRNSRSRRAWSQPSTGCRALGPAWWCWRQMAGREGFEPTGGHTGLDSAEGCNVGSHAMTWLCINEPSCQPRAGRNRAAHLRDGEVFVRHGTVSERWDQSDLSGGRPSRMCKRRWRKRRDQARGQQQLSCRSLTPVECPAGRTQSTSNQTFGSRTVCSQR